VEVKLTDGENRPLALALAPVKLSGSVTAGGTATAVRTCPSPPGPPPLARSRGTRCPPRL